MQAKSEVDLMGVTIFIAKTDHRIKNPQQAIEKHHPTY